MILSRIWRSYRNSKSANSLLSLPNSPKLNKQSRRRLIRWGLISGNIALLLAVAVFVLTNRYASTTIRSSTINSAVTTATSLPNPLDQLSSAQIALQTAQMTKLAELTAVRNQTDSENALLSIIPSDTTVVAKPQLVSTAQKSRKDIVRYTTLAGDTLTSIALKFSISSNSVRWSNNLSGEAVGVGKTLLIPPSDGIVYQVKANDTIDGIVSKHQSNRDLFITVNDAENGQLPVGEHVWIPNGVLASQVGRFRAVADGGFGWNYSPLYSGWGYDRGYCTWWAAFRRGQIGRPVPSNLGNAITWKVLASRSGLGIGTKPAEGAVIWTPASRGWGHVGFVEKVNEDGSIWVSDMNSRGLAKMDLSSGRAGGWNRVSYRLLSPDQAAGFWYIY